MTDRCNRSGEPDNSRTEYAMRNTSAAVISRITAIFMGYLTRVVFTHTLGADYVGINGLFSDILNVLSVSELGIGTAITFALYQPISENDVEKQKSLMQIFCRLYRWVAGFVLTAGLILVPFLDLLMKDQPDVDHLQLIYLLYLINSACSYLLIYKKTLIDAHQKMYVGVICHTVFLVIQDLAQIAVLLVTGNFILFLLIYLVCTVGNNLWISHRAEQMYPYLRDKNVQPLEKEERNSIFRNIRALLMNKLGSVMVNNTDNLLLSSMVGVAAAGCYSNYYLVIGSVGQVLNQIFQGLTASVGNLGVTGSREHIKTVFETLFFIDQWIYGFAAVSLYELLNPFVEISFGSQYLFDHRIVFVLCLNFWITGMQQAVYLYRDALGLFWYDRYRSIAEAVLNLVMSILLAWKFGTIGVFLGTLAGMVGISLWVEPVILYRRWFHVPVRQYFAQFLFYGVITGLSWLVTDFFCARVSGPISVVLAWRFLICAVVPNAVFLICYCRKREMRFLLGKLLKKNG